jgi:hypothetical protein
VKERISSTMVSATAATSARGGALLDVLTGTPEKLYEARI